MAGIVIIFFVVLTGGLAARKNRNRWGWGLFGLVPVLALLVLTFMPYLCPKCKQSVTNKEWKNRTCPRCGDVSEGALNGSLNKSPTRPTLIEGVALLVLVPIVLGIVYASIS